MKGCLGGFQRPQKEHREGAFGYQLAFGRFDIHVAYCSGAAFVRGMRAYGQNLPNDGLDTVIHAIEQADTIVVGSPVYWHNICGSVRNVLDRFYGKVENGSLSGRKLYFVFQGAAPKKWMLEAGEYTMKRFAALYGMTYGGMATNKTEAEKLSKEV